MRPWLTLLEKELIEHRIVIRLPLLLLAFAIINFVFVIQGDNVSFTMQSSGQGVIDWGIAQGTFAGLVGKLNEVVAGIVYLVLFFIYVPKTLRKEKQEGSLLFWRSMPVSDYQAIAVKLVFALVVIPLIAAALMMAADIIVWVMATLWLPQDVMVSWGISVVNLLIHGVEFLGRLALMSIVLFPIGVGLMALSQLTRYPLLAAILTVILFKVAMYQATGSSEAGAVLSEIYGLPFSILTSSSAYAVFAEFGFASHLVMLCIGIGLYWLSSWLRGRDDMLRMM
ncbi:ABC transporter [Photobacterium sp. ZSDE20]|uniref:ABC transporter n=1 Tax=Photobacterium pectinilyticum TaxID=2906793 RepID=A0ABT1N2U3_9GAMM|nr:ABC transporter [Photobacterium sp. ZSDE20]MCQ1059073.1 ABC transporter [Photobacterium sp. ZSDE20]MDD1824184.1 ABC transporter [Photobacterium sp. ZSDE20]